MPPVSATRTVRSVRDQQTSARFRGGHGVGEQHGDRERPDAARHGRDGAGHGPDGRMYIADDERALFFEISVILHHLLASLLFQMLFLGVFNL
jgi:hypothetical protein